MTRTLTLPGTLDALEPLGDFVREMAMEAGLGSRTGRLHLAIDEFVTNIINYGYARNGLTGNVELRADCDENGLTFVVEDTSPAYDPRLKPAPDNLDAPLEDRDIGGLGIFLTLRSVDRFDYERVGDKNRATFVMLKNPPPQAET